MSGLTTSGGFALGTLLLTSQGACAVETLRPGDELVTIRADGPALRRIARLTHYAAPGKLSGGAVPVCILAGAFAPLMPARDLILSGDHAVYADGALFELADLCNGRSIMAATAPMLPGWRVELDAHDVVLAEGLPVESSPAGFTAAAERPDPKIVVLYPGVAPVAREARCLPVIKEGAALVALRRMLDYRAGGGRRVLRG